MTRRRALGIFGAIAASIAGVGAAVKAIGSPAPRPKVVAGTVRLKESYGSQRRQLGEWGDDCRLVPLRGGHVEHLDPRSAAVHALATL